MRAALGLRSVLSLFSCGMALSLLASEAGAQMLPPALVASAGVGQFGGAGPAGGFGQNGGGFGALGGGNFGMGKFGGGNFGGGGGFAAAPGMGGFGMGAGGRGGVGMMGAGGFGNAPMTLPPRVGMVQVSNLIMQTTGERSSWPAGSTGAGFAGMNGNAFGRPGFGGPGRAFGFPSVPATSSRKTRHAKRPARYGT